MGTEQAESSKKVYRRTLENADGSQGPEEAKGDSERENRRSLKPKCSLSNIRGRTATQISKGH